MMDQNSHIFDYLVWIEINQRADLKLELQNMEFERSPILEYWFWLTTDPLNPNLLSELDHVLKKRAGIL